MEDLSGSIILNRYRVDEFIGEGGMADVYKVWDNQRAADLAMKVLRADLAKDAVFLRRLKRESPTLAKLQHPNIVRFYGLEQTDDFSFILMDYVDGVTLREEIDRAKSAFALERVLEVMKPVCSALHYAHAQGITHCDIKPANIMLHKNGWVLLSDFGIARMTESAAATAGAGTPVYMAPEQARGADPGPRTDIYALGIVLYEMLTGERPFTGKSASMTGSASEKIFWEQINALPPAPRSLNPQLSPALEAVALKCLQKDPDLRYQDALDLLDALTQAITDATPVQPFPKVEPLLPEQEAPVSPTPSPLPIAPIAQSQPTQLPPPPEASLVNWWVCGGIGLVSLCAMVCIVSIVGFMLVQKLATPAVPTPIDTSAPVVLPTDVAVPVSCTSAWNSGSRKTQAGPTLTPTVYPMAPVKPGFTPIRWFIGLGTGVDPNQLIVEQCVVDNFNAAPERAKDKIQLILEVVPYPGKDALLSEIAAGNGPDIIGPVGWNISAALHGQWLDLSRYIAQIPEVTKDFDPVLLASYKNDEGQVALPFAVYPSVIFYNTGLFDKAGLAYPPARYGDKYNLDGQMVTWDWETTVKTVAQRLTVDSDGRNVTQAGFNKDKIAQYGFSYNFENQPSYLGTFWANGSFTDASGVRAQIPPTWLDSWKWFYDGVWGEQPFIPNGQVSGGSDFGYGNVFNSGKVAMIDQPIWDMCCSNDVKTWDLGAMPSYHGKVNGRIDSDTFRIWKGTRNPDAAFTVITYLVTTGVEKLIIGSPEMPAAYGAVPARRKDFDAWLATRKINFPWVKNWDLVSAGLSYPDVPSAEAYMPNYNEAWTATGAAYARWLNTPGLDMNAEAEALRQQLQTIFDKR
ncbi:MAG: protein kinase [Anaerolineales bacterium]